MADWYGWAGRGNKVLFAAVMNDLYRAATRTGLGAVFGSKQLKAFVVKGNKIVPITRPDRFRTAIQKCAKDLTHTGLGTTIIIRRMGEGGYLGWRNWSSGVTPNFEEITGERFHDQYVILDKACFNCPRSCSHLYEVKDGPFKGVPGGGVECETLAAAGALCGHTNLEAILAVNNLCNDYGMDTIPAGAMRGWRFVTRKRWFCHMLYKGTAPLPEHGERIRVQPTGKLPRERR